MPIFDGVVTLADNHIPVVIEIGDGAVRLLASGTEVGRWADDECEIRHLDEVTFAISAEDETLEFVPEHPSEFAAVLNGHLGPVGEKTSPSMGMTSPAVTSPSPPEEDSHPSRETPRAAPGEPVPEGETVPNPGGSEDGDSNLTAVDQLEEPPPARPVTMALFYALCVATAALGAWALISIII